MEKKLKVLFLLQGNFHPEDKDGISKVTYNLLKKNQYYDSDVCILGNPVELNDKFDHLKINYILNHDLEDFKFKKRVKWFFSVDPMLAGFPKQILESYRWIKNNHSKYDVIFLSTLTLAPVLRFVNKDIRKKIFLSAIDSLSLYYKRRFLNESFIHKKLLWFIEYMKSYYYEKRYLKHARIVHFVSNTDEKYIQNRIQSFNTTTIRNGVNSQYFEKVSINTEERSLIFVGNFSYPPNQHACKYILNEISPKLNRFFRDYKIYFVGRNPPYFLLKAASVNHIITGYVDDIRPFMSKSQIFLSPLFIGSGLKNKILEAMACGKIIVGSTLSFEGINCISGEHNICLNENSKNWVNIIIKIFEEPQKYAFLGINAKKFVKDNFAWETIIQEYYENFKYISNN